MQPSAERESAHLQIQLPTACWGTCTNVSFQKAVKSFQDWSAGSAREMDGKWVINLHLYLDIIKVTVIVLLVIIITLHFMSPLEIYLIKATTHQLYYLYIIFFSQHFFFQQIPKPKIYCALKWVYMVLKNIITLSLQNFYILTSSGLGYLHFCAAENKSTLWLAKKKGKWTCAKLCASG